MSIFKTAYDTVAASGYRLSEIEDKLKAGHISHAFQPQVFSLDHLDETYRFELVVGGNTAADVVPYFTHPIFIRDSNDKQLVAYLDMRKYGKWMQPQQSFIIRNHPQYQWQLCRGLLNQIWISERHDLLRDVSTLPAAIYSALLSESIARKYALDPGEQITILVLACYFYYTLFTDEKSFNEFEFNKLVGKIAQITRVPATKVFSILDGEEPLVLRGLEDFCQAIKEKTGSVRLNEFHPGVLIAIVSGSWFSNDTREDLAVALEHPPTWLMICFAALNETTYKRTVLARLAERFAKGAIGSSFIKSVKSLLDLDNLFTEVD